MKSSTLFPNYLGVSAQVYVAGGVARRADIERFARHLEFARYSSVWTPIGQSPTMWRRL